MDSDAETLGASNSIVEAYLGSEDAEAALAL
jgi:hypothetical protein